MYFNYNQFYINVFQMNGWINGLTVYNVHVMFEFYSLLIRITVHFLFCAIPFETDSHTPGLYATTE
jgi:hypothetical protein